MRRAYLASDASFDGIFLFAVRTTGIFCRPSCPARKPNPENVEFFATGREALLAGYRPCKRCRPLDGLGKHPDWVERLIGEIDKSPDAPIGDAELRGRGIEPVRVRRYFQRHFGMTFQAYRRARRLGDAFTGIKNGKSIDAAALDAGFDSSSGFRDAFVRLFSKPPAAALARDYITVGWQQTPLGPMIAGALNDGICFLEFGDRRMLMSQLRTLQKRFLAPTLPGNHPLLDRLQTELAEYFAGVRKTFSLPLAYPGSSFQEKVWDALRMIPYGTTWSYEQLAEAIGSAGASRAVGRANGLNRIAILIPCHRVVAKNGALSGYGGGVWRKRYLIDFETRQSKSPA